MKYLLLMGSIGIATALRLAQLLAQPAQVDALANQTVQFVVTGEPGTYANSGALPSVRNSEVAPLQALAQQSAAGIVSRVGMNSVAAEELRMLLAILRQHSNAGETRNLPARTDRQIGRLARQLQDDADFLADISARLGKIYSTLTPDQAALFDDILRPSAALPPPMA